MGTDKEKLSILSEMIAFAQGDGEINSAEYDFLLRIAKSLNVKKTMFEKLLAEKVETVPLKNEMARIVQFHRLVLLMNIDNKQQLSEIKQLHDIGLKMGLPPAAIDQVLMVMHNYPHKIIPTKKLFEIFRAYHN